MSSVRWVARAKVELVSAAAWYEQRQQGLGSEFVDEVGRTVRSIVEMPTQFPRWDRRPGIRRAVVSQRFPYVLFFSEHGDTLFVYALAHTSRRPGYWIQRLESGEPR